MQLPTYQIIDWDKTYENSRSRQIQDLRWCSMPNSFDGSRISELIERGGAQAYAAWCAFALICSRSPTRGQSLKSSGQPHTLKSLARMSGLEIADFEAMLALATHPDVALLEEVAQERHPSVTPPSPERQADVTHLPKKEGKERKEGKKENTLPQPPQGGQSESHLNSLPTLAEWHGYAKGRPGYQPAAIAALYHHYAALGWQVGGKPIHSWRSLVDAKLAREAPPPTPAVTLEPDLIPEPSGDWKPIAAQITGTPLGSVRHMRWAQFGPKTQEKIHAAAGDPAQSSTGSC